MLEYCFIVHNESSGLNFMLTAEAASEAKAHDSIHRWLERNDVVIACIGVSHVLRTGK